MELDAQTQLRRFCFLSSFYPVYVHLREPLNVSEQWPKMQAICKVLDDIVFVTIMKDMLYECSLVRRDETLFAYAAYLATDLDVKWKSNVRKAFPALIGSDASDLFLFCKYAMAVQHELKHKGFSRTVRRAITSWYDQQTPQALQAMLQNDCGGHGFTHRKLLKLCHINDASLHLNDFAEIVFKHVKVDHHSTKMYASTEKDSKSLALSTSAISMAQVDNSNENCDRAVNTDSAGTANTDELSSSLPNVTASMIQSMRELRTTNNFNEALRIVRQWKLKYNQVPKRWLSHAPIVEALIPSMSYLQMLKAWRDFARYRHLSNPLIMQLCESVLNNKKLLHNGDIHPIVFLMEMHKLSVRNYKNNKNSSSNRSKMSMQSKKALQLPYFQKLYAQSFGQNVGTGLRMHITINLQMSYRKKFLHNHKNLSFYDAAIALAFGYFKREKETDVHYWTEEKMKLQQIPWTQEMNIEAALACCDEIKNTKNFQRLVAPVMHAMFNKRVYDVFIAITPSAGRGNPKHNSSFLCKFIDKYRATKNAKAKYVIIDLLRHRRSMQYSISRNENILEICGLDEHTTKLVNDFALNRFG